MTNHFTVLGRGNPLAKINKVDFIRLYLENYERARFYLGRQGEANIISEGSANLPKVNLQVTHVSGLPYLRCQWT